MLKKTEELALQEVEEGLESNQSEHDKLLNLKEKIETLKELISEKVLSELKQCKKNCKDVNNIIGELHASIKKS